MCGLGVLQDASQQIPVRLQRRSSSSPSVAGKAQVLLVTATANVATVLPHTFVHLSAGSRRCPFGSGPCFFPPPALFCHIIAVHLGGVPPKLNNLGSHEGCLTMGRPWEHTQKSLAGPRLFFLYYSCFLEYVGE